MHLKPATSLPTLSISQIGGKYRLSQILNPIPIYHSLHDNSDVYRLNCINAFDALKAWPKIGKNICNDEYSTWTIPVNCRKLFRKQRYFSGNLSYHFYILYFFFLTKNYKYISSKFFGKVYKACFHSFCCWIVTKMTLRGHWFNLDAKCFLPNPAQIVNICT